MSIFIQLLDFGLSSKYTEKGTSGIVGTPYSMAPEVVKDSCYTEACDLWSLGVVLYILLFREVPFHVQLTRDGSMPKIRYEPISSLMWNQVCLRFASSYSHCQILSPP
jgi:serine/threonine protein kinase